MTRDGIRRAIFEELGAIAPEASPAALKGGEDIRVALDIDSMDFLNLVIALHERLGVDIPEADYPLLATLDGAIDYLAARVP